MSNTQIKSFILNKNSEKRTLEEGEIYQSDKEQKKYSTNLSERIQWLEYKRSSRTNRSSRNIKEFNYHSESIDQAEIIKEFTHHSESITQAEPIA